MICVPPVINTHNQQFFLYYTLKTLGKNFTETQKNLLVSLAGNFLDRQAHNYSYNWKQIQKLSLHSNLGNSASQDERLTY